MEQIQSIQFPRMVVNVNLVGQNSLIGALTLMLIQNGYIKHLGILNPDEIVFTIKKVMPEINLYDEINKVRDFMKIDEKKITVFIV